MQGRLASRMASVTRVLWAVTGGRTGKLFAGSIDYTRTKPNNCMELESGIGGRTQRY